MSTPVTIQVKLDSKQAEVAVAELNTRVTAAFASMREGVGKLNAQMRELTFNPSAILRGTDQATRGIEGAGKAAAGAAREMQTLKGDAAQSGESLAALGRQATGTGGTLDRLAGTTGAANAVFTDLATEAAAADTALLSIEEGAAAAGKSVAGMGRAAASALPKLDALSGAAFDPAGVVAGADEAAAALGRVTAAAAETRGAVRGAGAGAPLIFGRRLPAEGRPVTFGGGFRAGVGAVGDLGGAAAMITTILAAVSGKLAMNFDNTLQGIRGNTTMTDADAAGMRSQTLNLMKTGTSEEQLAQGYKHIANFGYHGPEAAQIAAYGNRFGIGTHTNVEETDDMLAGMMNANRHAPASQVSRYANMAHFAAAGSNMDVKDLEKNSTRTVGLAANYMGTNGIADALAAYSALVQHRLNPARADTQVSGMLGQIAAPTPKAEKEAAKLGIKDFNAEGLKAPGGLFAIINEVKEKLASLPTNEKASALKALFNNKQGGTGASFLTGAANDSYKTAYNDPKTGTKAAFAGKVNAIDPAYNAQMDQPAQKIAALKGKIASNAVSIGESFHKIFITSLPMLTKFTDSLASLLKSVTKLPAPVQEAILAFGGFKLLTAFLPMLSGFSLISEKTSVVLGGLSRALLGGGAAADVGAAGIAGMALPLVAVAAAVALFALAWKSDFGHIREVTARVGADVAGFVKSQFGYVKTWFVKNMPLIREAVHTALTFMEQFWKSHGSRIMAIVTPLWSFIKTLFSAALHIIGAVVKFALDIITGHWSAAGKDIGVIVTNLWAVVRSLFVNGGKAIGNALMLVIDTVLDFGKRLFEGMLNAGQQAINGLVGGIKSGIGKVSAAASSLASSIPSAVTGILDIHSPSRVMHKIGEHTSQGLADGITAGKSGVTAAMRSVVEAALAETDHKKAALRIDHEARSLRAGGMSASDVADFRESAKAQLPAGRTLLDRTSDAGRGSLAGTGEAIAEAAFQKYSRGLSRSYQGLCEGLAHDTYRSVTGAYEKYMADGRGNSALKTLARFQHAGLAERYTPGMALAPGSLLYSDKLGHGKGHVATIGPHGERLDQHGVNAFPEKDFDWFVPPPGAAKDERKASRSAKVAQTAAAHLSRAQAQINETLAQIHDGLSAFTQNPETPTLDKQETVAKAQYRRQIKGLGGDTFGPYARVQQQGMTEAATLLADKLSAIDAQRREKKASADTAAAEEADAATKSALSATAQLQRELWQHAGGDMNAYFASLITEADTALKAVQDKFGPKSSHPNAPAVQAATEEHSTRVQLIGQQQTDAANTLADQRQQHDLEQGKISLAEYRDYLKGRRNAYAEYSQAWLDLDSRVYAADEELQKKQLQSIEDLFQAKKISLDAYKKMLSDLAAQVPVQSSVHEDVVRAGIGAETRIRRGETVGGTDFWDSLAGSAAESGSRVLTALLHPKDKKSIFKSLWDDLLGSMESGVTGSLSKMIKNMITGAGGGSGGGIGGFLGGLFGHGKQKTDAAGVMGQGVMGQGVMGQGAMGAAGLSAGLSMIPGMGSLPLGNLLSTALPGMTGINGPVVGSSQPLGILSMLGGKGGLSALLGQGGLASLAHLLPWLGGGLLLNSALGNPLGKVFKGIKKLFHFSGGGVVPGTGSSDTVPAMLTPKEMVLPVALSKRVMAMAAFPDVPRGAARFNAGPAAARSGSRGDGRAGDSIVIHQTGDHIYHTEMDVKRANRDLARTMERARRGGVPSAA